MSDRYSVLPPLQCLRAFLAVAELRNFTRAAERLGLTQTAVSHQISQLEKLLGRRLFDRGPSGVSVTAAGQVLLPHVDDGLRALREGIDQVRKPPRRGRAIVIDTTPELASQYVTPRIAGLMEERPDLSISLQIGRARADVAAGEADIGVWSGPGGPGLESRPLGLEREFAVCSPGLMDTLPPRQAILAAPLLTHDGARHTLLDWQRAYEQMVGPRLAEAPAFDSFEQISFPDFDAMLAACRAGAGFALVRTSLAADDIARGRLVQAFVEETPSDLQYHLVTRTGPLPEAVAIVRDRLLERADPGPGR